MCDCSFSALNLVDAALAAAVSSYGDNVNVKISEKWDKLGLPYFTITLLLLYYYFTITLILLLLFYYYFTITLPITLLLLYYYLGPVT